MTTRTSNSKDDHPPTTSSGSGKAFSLQRTYTGLLDDVMIRYSDEFLSRDFFNKMIAKNLIFGGGLYINDGYLVNHPIAREYLYKDNSLLRRMLATGFIRILTRTDSPEALSNMPVTMAKQENASFMKLVSSAEWNEFKSVFGRIAQAVFHNNTIRSWPNRNMSVGFTKLMRDRAFAEEEPIKLGIGNVSRDEWLRIGDDFLSRDPESSGSRDKLEKAALNILNKTRSDPRMAMNQVMTVGNQAYHYNFGLALTAEETNGVATDTTIGSAFDELLQTRTIQEGQLDNIPIFKLPRDMPFERGDLFLDFIDPSSKVYEAKLSYIRSLRDVISGVDLDFSSLRSNLKEATNEYKARVKYLFSLDEDLDESFTLAVGNLSNQQVGNNVIATAAPTAGLAIEIQDTVNKRGRQFLIERFQLRDVSEAFDPSQDVRLSDIRSQISGDIRPHISSLAFDEDEAARFIDDIPPAPRF